jgi:hypothetical protein
MMNRLAVWHETWRAVISARNISFGVPALLQWTAGPWLLAEDAVGSHSTANGAVTKIETARKAALLWHERCG